jgi:hypothetical protein
MLLVALQLVISFRRQFWHALLNTKAKVVCAKGSFDSSVSMTIYTDSCSSVAQVRFEPDIHLSLYTTPQQFHKEAVCSHLVEGSMGDLST